MANVATTSVGVNNVIANAYGSFIGTAINKPPTVTDTANSYGAYGRGDTLANDLNEIGTVTIGTPLQPVYRGFLSGQYVYSVGTPPPGASDVIIVGYE